MSISAITKGSTVEELIWSQKRIEQLEAQVDELESMYSRADEANKDLKARVAELEGIIGAKRGIQSDLLAKWKAQRKEIEKLQARVDKLQKTQDSIVNQSMSWVSCLPIPSQEESEYIKGHRAGLWGAAADVQKIVKGTFISEIKT